MRREVPYLSHSTGMCSAQNGHSNTLLLVATLLLWTSVLLMVGFMSPFSGSFLCFLLVILWLKIAHKHVGAA